MLGLYIRNILWRSFLTLYPDPLSPPRVVLHVRHVQCIYDSVIYMRIYRVYTCIYCSVYFPKTPPRKECRWREHFSSCIYLERGCWWLQLSSVSFWTCYITMSFSFSDDPIPPTSQEDQPKFERPLVGLSFIFHCPVLVELSRWCFVMIRSVD